MSDFFKASNTSRILSRKNSSQGKSPGFSFTNSISPRKIALQNIPFKNDEKGNCCKVLWENYYNEYSNFESVQAGDINLSEKLRNSFANFADYFINVYDIRDRGTLLSIQGHPNILIEHIIQQFLSNVTVKVSQPKQADVKVNGYSWLRNPNYGEQILKGSCKSYLNNELLDLNVDQLSQIQHHFIRLISVLSILLRWPHNQSILLEKYGYGFAKVIIDVISSLIERLDDIIVGWCDARDSKSQLNENYYKMTKFILTVLLHMTHIYASDGITIPKSEFETMQLTQPFSLSDISKIWNVNVTCSQDINIANSYKSDTKLQSTDDEGISWDVESTSLGFLDNFIGVNSTAVLSTALRKLVYLSAATLPFSTGLQPLSVNLLPDSSESIWKLSLIVQVEILSAFSKIIKCSSAKFLHQFKECSGVYGLKSLLSMKDTRASVDLNDDNIKLICLRCLLVLKLNVYVVDALKCTSVEPIDESHILQAEFLFPVTSWMVKLKAKNSMAIRDTNFLNVEFRAPCYVPDNFPDHSLDSLFDKIKQNDPVAKYLKHSKLEVEKNCDFNYHSTSYARHINVNSSYNSKSNLDYNVFEIDFIGEYMKHFFDFLYLLVERMATVDNGATTSTLNIMVEKMIGIDDSSIFAVSTVLLKKYLENLKDIYFSTAEDSVAPLFQFNLVKFLIKLQKNFPLLSSQIFFETGLFILLITNSNFLQSGQNIVNNLVKSYRRKVKYLSKTNGTGELVETWYRVYIDCTNETCSDELSGLKIFSFHYKFLHDMILDLVCSIFEFVINSASDFKDNSKASVIIVDYIKICVQGLSMTTCHDIVIQMCRVLNRVVHLVTTKQIRLPVWAHVMADVSDICKNQVITLNYLEGQGDSLAFHSEALPCFWPARVAILSLIQMIVSSHECSGWIHGFLVGYSPLSTTSHLQSNSSKIELNDVSAKKQRQSIPDLFGNTSFANEDPDTSTLIRSSSDTSVKSTPIIRHRHLAILRLILFPRCRYVALYIIGQILRNCAVIACGGFNESSETQKISQLDKSKPPLSAPKSVSIIASSEALGHDVIRVCLHIVKNSSKQRELEDSYYAAFSVLENFMVMFDVSSNHSTRTWYWRLFEGYGPISLAHKEYSWKHSYGNIYIEMWQAIDECLKIAGPLWSNEKKSGMMHMVLYIMGAIMSGNYIGKETFKQLIILKHNHNYTGKNLTDNGRLVGSVSPAVEEIVRVIVNVEQSPSLQTITLLFQLMYDNSFRFAEVLNTFNYEAISFKEVFEGSVPPFSNMNMIVFLLVMVPYCQDSAQQLILHILMSLISSDDASVNIYKCSTMEPSIIDILLDIFPHCSQATYPKLSTVLSMFGKHIVTVSQLKRIFRLIKTKSCDLSAALLDSLKSMINESTGPKNFLFFEGTTSSLLLPHMQKWPATKGYSISLWFTVNMLHESSNRVSPHSSQNSRSTGISRSKPRGRWMYLVSLRQDSGIGLDISLYMDFGTSFKENANIMLSVKIYSNGKDPIGETIASIPNIGKSLSTENWHHLGLSHSPSTLRKKSEINILLDGQLSHHVLSYPRFTEGVNYPVIGDCNPLFKDENLHINFKGKLGSIYFFSEALNEEQLTSIYNLGPSYDQTFDDNGLFSGHNDMHSKLLNGSISNSIMIAFNPGVWKHRHLMDITPEKNINRWKVSASSEFSRHPKSSVWINPNALRMKGTHRCTSNDMRDSFDCLGGVKVFLPMLAQLDSSISDDNFSPGFLCSKILNLLFDVFRDTNINVSFMSEDGIVLLAYILEKISPKHLSVLSLQSLINGFTNLQWAKDCQAQMLRHIFGNFRLWISCDFDSQMYVLNYLVSLSTSSPVSVYETIPVQKMFDALLSFYTASYCLTSFEMNEDMLDKISSAKKTPRKSSNSDSIVLKAKTKSFQSSTPWRSLSEIQIDSLRAQIFQLINILSNISPDAYCTIFQCLLTYIAGESDDKYKIEGLLFVLRLLSPNKYLFVDRFLMGSCGSLYFSLMTSLHCHSHPKVRVYACVCFCQMIQIISARGKLPSQSMTENLPSPIVNSVNEAKEHQTNRGRAASQSDETIDTLYLFGIPLNQLANHFLYLQQLLKLSVGESKRSNSVHNQFEIVFQAFQLTMHGLSCKSLISVIEKSIHLDSSLNDVERPPSKSDHRLTNNDIEGQNIASMKICISSIFPALMELIKNEYVSSQCRVKFLLELKTSIQTFDNIEVLLTIPRWQTCFFELLVEEQSNLLSAEKKLMAYGWNGDLTNPEFSKASDVNHDLNVYTAQDCRAMFDITVHILADIHIHAVRYCFPQSESFVFARPIQIGTESKLNRMSAREIVEFHMKEHRKLGANMIDETVSYLRYYAEHSNFDARLIGVELLLKVVQGIKREKNSIASSADSQELKDIRRKMFEINLWIITYIISEFFSIPPVQRSKSSLYPSLTTNGRFSFESNVSEVSKSKLSINTNLEFSNSISLLGVSNEENLVHTFPNAQVLDNEKLLLSVETNSTASDCDLNNSKNKSPESPNFELNSTIEINNTALGLNVNENLSLEEDDYFMTKWKLVDTLLEIVGAADGLSTMGSESLLDRLRLGMKIGLLLGINVITQMNDSIGHMMTPVDEKTQKGLPTRKRENPIARAVDSVGWIIIRLLLNIYLQGANSKRDILESSPFIQALTKLSGLLRALKDKNKPYYDLEVSNAVCKVVKSIRNCNQIPTSLWVTEGLRFIISILPFQKHTFSFYFSKYSEISIEAMSNASLDYFSVLNQSNSKKVRGSQSIIIEQNAQIESIMTQVDAKSKERLLSGKESACSDLLMDCILLSLFLPTDELILTWETWDLISNTIFEEAQQIENDFFLSKTNDLGMHKGSQEILVIIQGMRNDAKLIADHIAQASEDCVERVIATELKRFKESQKQDEISRRKANNCWNSRLDEVANERGPWGSGVDEESEKFWIQDPHTNQEKMRCVFVKNSFGSRHSGSSYLAQHSLASTYTERTFLRRAKTTDNLNREKDSASAKSMLGLTPVKKPMDFGDTDSSNTPFESSSNDLENLGMSSPIRASSDILKKPKTIEKSDLWKDLMKYQKRSLELDGADEGELYNSDLGESDSDISSDDLANLSNEGLETGNISSKKLLFRENCEIITPSTNSSSQRAFGFLEVTTSAISFVREFSETSLNTATSSKIKSNQVSSISLSSTISASQLMSTISSETQWAYSMYPSTTWPTSGITAVGGRFYQLRYVAVEMCFTSRTSVFINFYEQTIAYQFLKIIHNKIKPPLLRQLAVIKQGKNSAISKTSRSVIQNLTQSWVNREISNFEYLMQLNDHAGRTLNDLGQYPVFPWIISDYTSEELNLKDSKTFRDLKYPMGAQNPNQRANVKSKYDELNNAFEGRIGASIEHGAMPPFHFGTHYSVAGFVMWFLIRCEPFSSLHIQLQDGKFDKADRLFESFLSAYRSCTSNPSDVKELIPELFYLPECLINENGLDLGVTQTGKRIDNVVLPPWAMNSPHEFVRLHREALECDFVSKNLHNWIDLIFGYKQRPPYLGGHPSAAEFANCFYYLTYSDAVDLEKLRRQDKVLYEQYICQISEFGSTPSQLFLSPHPERKSLAQADIVWPIASVVLGANSHVNELDVPKKPKRLVTYPLQQISGSPIVFIGECIDADRLMITLDLSRIMAYHVWQTLQPSAVPPFKIKVDTASLDIAQGNSGFSMLSILSGYNNVNINREHRIGVPFAPRHGFSSSLYNSDSHIKALDAQKWKPVRVSTYEKNERKGKERAQDRKQSHSTADDSSGIPLGKVSLKTELSSLTSEEYNLNIVKDDLNRNRSFSDSVTNSNLISNNTKTAEKIPLKDGAPSRRQSLDSNTNIGNINHSHIADNHITSNLFVHVPELKLFFTAGHWDHSLRVTSVETGKLIQSLIVHKDIVTCIATSSDYGNHYFVSGSRDCTVMVWSSIQSKDEPLNRQPRILYGHDDTVNCVAINAQLNIIVSGSSDGTVIVHSLRDFEYIRSIVFRVPLSISFEADYTTLSKNQILSSDKIPVTWISISKERYIVTYSSTHRRLSTHSINGHLIASKLIQENLHALTLSEDGMVLVTGGDSCLVVFRWVHNLELANDGPRKGFDAIINGADEDSSSPNSSQANPLAKKGVFLSPIRSLFLTKQERHLFVGFESGEIKILAMDGEYIRERLQKKLIEIGIL